MNFTVINCEQRTPEWVAARIGRVCASDADAMLATVQKGEAAGRRNLRMKLVLERVTGKPQESGGGYVSQSMLNGIEREGQALAMYEAHTGLMLMRSGFVQHTAIMAGWSPDGHLHDFRGFVEAKCPEPATHFETLTTEKIPTKYLRQMLHGGFWIGGAEWGDFVSFHPDFPEDSQLFIKRVHRDEFDIAAHESAVKAFLAEVERDVEMLRAKIRRKAVA